VDHDGPRDAAALEGGLLSLAELDSLKPAPRQQPASHMAAGRMIMMVALCQHQQWNFQAQASRDLAQPKLMLLCCNNTKLNYWTSLTLSV